jgi:hypothetical protein
MLHHNQQQRHQQQHQGQYAMYDGHYQGQGQGNLMPPGKKMMSSSVPQDLWMESDLSPIQDVSPSIEAAEQHSMDASRRNMQPKGRPDVSLPHFGASVSFSGGIARIGI